MCRNSPLSFSLKDTSFEVVSEDRSQRAYARAFSFLPGKKADAPDHLIIRGELDIGVHSRLHTVLTALKPSTKQLVFDLTRVTYIDCASLSLLRVAQRTFSQTRPVAYRFDEKGLVWHIIRLLKLDRYMPVASNNGRFQEPASGAS